MPPWDRYAQQAPAQAPQPQQAQGADPIIRPAPGPAPVTPVQEQNMRVQNERLGIAQDANARAEEEAARKAEAAARGTVDQGRAAGFLRRAINGDRNFQQAGATPRGIIGQAASERFPNISNTIAEPDRQLADQAEREFLQGILRYDSGAAIPPDELVSMGRTYFPRPGDSPAVIAQKAEARRVAIEGLVNAAGPAGAQVWSQFQGQQDGDPVGGAGGTTGGNTGPQGGNSGSNGPRFTPPAGPQPTLQDLYPEGAQMGMDQWGQPDAPFDRIEYLRGLGIQPDAERQLVGVLNATAREKGAGNVTQEDVLRAYEQAGIRPGDEAAIGQILTSLNEGRQLSGFDTTTAEQEYSRALDQTIDQQGGNPEAMSGAIGGGAVQGLTLNTADEISGIGGALNAAIRGQNPVAGYQAERDVSRREFQRAREANPTAFGISEFGGAMVSGGVRVAPAAMRAARPVAAAAREGAIVGAVAGFGAGEGLNSLGGAAVGAGTGALAGAGLTAGARALAPGVNRIAQAVRGQRVAPALDDVNAVVQAGERMDVPVRRADVDPSVRDTRANIMQSPAGQAVRATEADDLVAMEGALMRELGSEGAARDPFAAGETVQTGVNRVIDSVRQRAGRLYDRASARSQSEVATPTNALAEIDRNIAELEAIGPTQNAAAINFLRGVRSDMAREGGLSIGVIRAQRTNLRGNIEQAGLRATDMDRRMTGILQAANGDIETALANNPEARALFGRADALWRQQAEFGDAIARSIVGTSKQPVSPEMAAQRIASFVGRDFNRARQLLAQLDPATREEIAGQVAASLGRNTKGEFSLAQFITHTGGGKGRLLNERTTRLIFGERGVEAIRDLRTLAGAKVAATERNNNSNTGGIINRAGRGLRTMMMGAVGLSEGGVTGGAVTIAASKLMERLGEGRAVRLLTNPDFTKWMRRLPETDNPRAIDGAFGRLRRVASGNAQFQSDVQAFEQALLGAANDNAVVAGNVAASPPEQQEP